MNYKITYDGKSFTLTADELMSPEVQAALPEDIQWEMVSSNPTPDEQLSDRITNSGLPEVPYDRAKSVQNDHPATYETYNFRGIDGKNHQFTGTSFQDAYGQAIAGGLVAEPSSQARIRMADLVNSDMGGFMAQVAPNQTGDLLTGQGMSPVSVAKDIFSVPGRAYSTLYDLATGGDADLGRTSTESAEQGRTGESILTSPLLFPNLAAAAATAGASIPAQMATTAGVGVGSGYLLEQNYGQGNAALDIVLSAIPALGPVLARLPINASTKAITGALAKVGITGDDAKQLIPAIQKGGYKAGKAIGEAETQRGYGLIAKDVIPSKIPANELSKIIFNRSASDAPYLLPPQLQYAKSLRGGEPINRSLQEVTELNAKLPVIQEQIDLLNSLAKDMSPERYRKHIQQLLTQYGDIPEVRDLIVSSTSKAHQAMGQAAGELPIFLRENGTYRFPARPDINAGDCVLEGLAAVRKGEQLSKLTPPKAPVSDAAGHSIEDLIYRGGKRLLAPTPTVTNAASSGLRYLIPTASAGGQTVYEDEMPWSLKKYYE